MRFSRCFLTVFSLLTLLCACQPWYQREPLEVMDPQKVRMRLIVDWSVYYEEMPSGMTVMLFSDEYEPQTIVTANVSSVYLDLMPGHYRLVLFNKSVNDFPSMQFENMDTYPQMTVRATTFSPTYYTDWTKGENFTYDPENLGTLLESFEVTEEMLLTQTNFYPYKEWIKQKRSNNADTRFYQDEDLIYVIEVLPKPVISQLYVSVHISNFRNLASIEGYITGFADGWHITEDHATANDDTRYLLDKWTVTDDQDFNGNGWAVATTTVWGEPNGKEYRPERPLDQHVLTLHLTLQDGTTVDYVYNVGQDVRYITSQWDNMWSYTEVTTKTLVLTIWDRDPGNDPGTPDDPTVIKPDDPGNPDDPDNPVNPGNPDDPREPALPDVEGKDETGKTDSNVEVKPWESGGKYEIPI